MAHISAVGIWSGHKALLIDNHMNAFWQMSLSFARLEYALSILE